MLHGQAALLRYANKFSAYAKTGLASRIYAKHRLGATATTPPLVHFIPQLTLTTLRVD